MTPREGYTPDPQKLTSIDALAEAQHIADQISGGDADVKRQIAEDIAPFIYARLNARIQGDVRDDRKIRVLHEGADVTDNASGTAVKYPGESYFDELGLYGGQAWVESDINGRRINFRAGGGGADCMFDYLVST